MRKLFRYCFLLATLPAMGVTAPNRVANSSLALPAELPSGTYSTTNAFPGLTFTDPVVIATPPGETNRLFVVEKPGRIAVIPNLANPSREVFLDITARVRTVSNEEGLLGLAFHPNYNNAGATGYGEFFVYYQTTIATQPYWRLSRFSVNPGDPDRGDANSEVPMITQRDEAGNHNGGDLHFGDEGYLYVSVGDEGSSNDSLDNGQHIDKDFFAAILRLDVDRLPGNLLPNNHSSVQMGTYKVPADNPFVGATSFNGSTVAPSNIRTEIWAIGLRNPWRMSFDRPTGRLFVADVGQVSREEINILDAASFSSNGGVPNYGWSYREGFLAFTNGPGGATPPAGFSAIDPIHDYDRSLGVSVTGGLVYRGSQYPELTGDYLFADYISGRIWAMDDPGGASQAVTEIANDNNIAGFGIDPVTGDILLGDLGSDAIKRLVRTTGGGTQPPQFLSQTGAFSDLSALTPEAGIQAYEVNVPFWSDHAEKTRWFSIPDLGDLMTWSENADWGLPEGQVWIKHFELELNRDNPGADRRRIETRFLVKTDDDIYGITYRWNSAQTDAELVAEGGFTEDFTVTENSAARTQTWKYPSRADCRTCHNETAGFALSFNTRQLNRDFDYGTGPENQLEALETAAYFANSIPDPAGLSKFHSADDQSISLQDRARSYLSVNCVSCHQPGGAALGGWNARPEIILKNSGIIGSQLSNNGGNPDARTIVPGSPDDSMILQRLLVRETGAPLPPMPPLASCETDADGAALLNAWIESLRKVLFVRGADRSGGFLEGTNDAERTEHLADINNTTTGGGNHGWGELAQTLRDNDFIVEQITETAENGSGPSQGLPVDFTNVDLDEYRVLVLGSNNAVYDSPSIDAVETWIRAGGSALFISDANFGGDWADAPSSDQQFLDRFGLIMNQDRGTYSKRRSSGDFLSPNHEIFDSVNEFHGEGVSPISVGSLASDVTATVLATAEGQVRRNTAPFGSQNQGPSSTAAAQDAALLIGRAGNGKIAGHYDRNTFFNQGGVGSDITVFDNRQYAINLFQWLAESAPNIIPAAITATDGTFTDRIELTWSPVENATYRVYRNTTNDSSAATFLAGVSGTSYTDNSSALDGARVYFYWVSAFVEDLESSLSVVETGVKAIPTVLNLNATNNATTDGVFLFWNAHSDANSYDIFRSTADNFASATLIDSTPSDNYLDETAVGGTGYFYWVVATNDHGSSAPPPSVFGRRRAFLFQPDLIAGKSNDKLVGDNIYGGGKTPKVVGKNRRSIAAFFLVQNDGEIGDQARLSASKDNRYFKVRYIRTVPSAANITGDLTRNRYVSSVIASGGYEVIRVIAKPTKSTKRSKRSRKFKIAFNATSINQPAKGDRISVKAISKK